MVDGIFFINHALSVNQLSVYTDEQRFLQTLDTVKSIDTHCPNNIKYIFDSSPNRPNIDYIQQLQKAGVTFVYLGGDDNVRKFSNLGIRSIAETISFMMFLGWFKNQNVSAKRIYKLSGRYQLNENFVLNDDRYDNAFVFSSSLSSWLSDQQQQIYGVNRLYRLRLWHMSYSCLDLFMSKLPKILNDCSMYAMDVEHAYYKNLHMEKTVEVERIGVCGNIAPSGEYINE